MKLGNFRRGRFAFRVAFVVLGSLLFQQAAVASYACPVDQVPAEAMADMPDCESMSDTDPQALCAEHCNPGDTQTPDARAIGAQAGTQPPEKFELVRSLPARHGPQTYENIPPARSDPPPIVRFCSLLI